MGLTNVKVMIPFCRTLERGPPVLAELRGQRPDAGRERELEVYVMCEIPNNVILAEEFAELFDGFSIGSNDLTQLTLGVDRDSELLAHLFDERDPGVKRLIAHGRGGGAPQGPEGRHLRPGAQRLPGLRRVPGRDLGIDSISLNPDSLPQVAERLKAARAELPVPIPATVG